MIGGYAAELLVIIKEYELRQAVDAIISPRIAQQADTGVKQIESEVTDG